MEFDINLSDADYGLTPSTRSEAQARRMNKTLMMWLTHTDWNDTRLCREVGIDLKTLSRYRENEVFMSKYDECCHRMFRSLQSKALEALERKVMKDDIQAIKYTLDGNNYAATQKLDVSADVAININIED